MQTSRTVSVAGKAIVIREAKTLVNGDYTCLMSPWSGCERILNDSIKDPKHLKFAKSGDCTTDYYTLRGLWSSGVVTRSECEAAGMIRPVTRQTKHRVLTTLDARRAK